MINYITINEFRFLKIMFNGDLNQYRNLQIKFVIDKFRCLTKIKKTSLINSMQEENLIKEAIKIHKTIKKIKKNN